MTPQPPSRDLPRRRFLLGLGAALAALAAAGIAVDQLTALRPAFPGPRPGEPTPPRTQKDEPWAWRPFAPTFEERRQAFLEFACTRPTGGGRGGFWGDIPRLELGRGPLSRASFQEVLDFIAARQDCSDFAITGLLRILYQYAASPLLPPDLLEAIRRTVLDFKYWIDEPGQDEMVYWTENHQILFHAGEYLAGQLFPEAVFTNNGWTGRQHVEHARPLILRWLDWRARLGFSEWDSNCYYAEDIAPLVNLVDFCRDEAIATRTAMVLDLLLFDMAVDSFFGVYGTSHGRTYARHVKGGRNDSLVTTQCLLWGLGRFASSSGMDAVSLATSRRYRLPPVIETVALDVPEALTNRECQGIELEDAPRYGLTYDDFDSGMFFWGMETFSHWRVIDLTVRMADAWKVWNKPDFRDLRDLGHTLGKLGLLRPVSYLLDPDPNRCMNTQVNKLTYRTLDYQLSCAQDYRRGEKGYQHHIWQATLGPDAVVFATNPGALHEDNKYTPNYWAGQNRLPRAVQHRNVLLCLYDLGRHKGFLEPRHYLFTHAYFPRWAFDQVEEADGWIFGRFRDGYVALYSHLPYEWTQEGREAGQEVVAVGRRNVWICQCGRRAVDGTFQEFMQAILGARLQVRGLSVEYQAPGVGLLSLGCPRFDNPYCRAGFAGDAFRMEHAGRRLTLDFAAGRRLMQ